jgi:ubiquitin C-terminal hydrolase
LINKEWINKYLEITNMKNIYDFLLANEIMVKNIVNENKPKNEKISNIISNIDKKLLEKLNSNKIIYSSLEDFNLINIKTNNVEVYTNRYLKILDNFVLVKEETYKLFMENIKSKFMYNQYFCLFGENRIFLIIMDNNQFTVEIGYLNNQSKSIDFNCKIILEFFNYDIITRNINKIIENDFSQYCDFSLAFKNSKDKTNDYASPIFNSKCQIIGYAYQYNISIKNYTKYHINNHLKTLIMYYLYNKQLINLKSNELKFVNYFLVNEDYLLFYKKYFNYNYLKEEIMKNNSNLILNNIRIDKFDNDLLVSKKIIVFIKNSLFNLNVNLNEKQNTNDYINNKQIEPDLPFYYYQNNNFLMYYSNFEILNETIYNLIFKKDESNKQKNNYIQCLFLNNIIMIKLSQNITGINQYVIEVGFLNSENIFCPNYILIYKEERYFYWHINYIKNTFNDISIFFKGLSFNNRNCLPLYDENNNEIGKIYNLNIKIQNFINPNTNNNIMPNNIMQNFNMNNNFIGNQQNIINLNTFPKNNVPIQNPKKEQIKKLTITNDFPFPPKIGLQNVGATCYMNATLQCFCQIQTLVDYFKYKPYVNDVIEKYRKNKKDCLTDSFKYLVENLWPSIYDYINNKYNHQNTSNKYFEPYKFKEKINKMNPLFQGAQANDSKDLVNFIIMTLHEELNKAKKISNPNKNILIDQTNEKNVFNLFIESYKNENMSIISDIFFGINNTSIHCSRCKTTKYNFQIYFFLLFPLEEVRKFKIGNLTNNFMKMNQNIFIMNPMLYQQNLLNFNLNIQNMNSITIYDCLEYNQKIDYFTGENSMFCCFCKNKTPTYFQTKLYSSPQILIIVLKRGKGTEFKVKLEFDEELNLINFVELKEAFLKYRLIGVVSNIEKKGISDHFIAYCKSPIDKEWYKYDDDLVSKVLNFRQEIIDDTIPYILFFQKQ